MGPNIQQQQECNRTASGMCADAGGLNTQALGVASHAEGATTIAGTQGFAGANIMGRFGDADAPNSWYVGNGTGGSNRGLAAKLIGANGNMFIDGQYSDYAEMFETIDDGTIDVGYFVTLEGDKIRKANASDDYILGVMSATPCLVGDSGALRWKDKYITDEWGRVQYQDVLVLEYMDHQAILNPEWDHKKEYISRFKRPKWVVVGIVGKIFVRDDGTCKVNGYCRPNDEGIATVSDKGYKVIFIL